MKNPDKEDVEEIRCAIVHHKWMVEQTAATAERVKHLTKRLRKFCGAPATARLDVEEGTWSR